MGAMEPALVVSAGSFFSDIKEKTDLFRFFFVF